MAAVEAGIVEHAIAPVENANAPAEVVEDCPPFVVVVLSAQQGVPYFGL